MLNYRHPIGAVCVVVSLAVTTGGCESSSNASVAASDQHKQVVVNDGPEGDSGVSVGDIRYPLDSALGDIWGVSDAHYQIDFTLTNGNFTLETIVVDGVSHQVLVPAQATAIVYAQMYSAGDSFYYGSYTFVPPHAVQSVLPGVDYFTNAVIGVDSNNDGMVTDEERYAVIEGIVDFDGSVPDISLSFSMTLSSGQLVTGEYTGLYDYTKR